MKSFSQVSKSYKASAPSKKLTTLFYVAYITLGLTTPFLLPARMASKDTHTTTRTNFVLNDHTPGFKVFRKYGLSLGRKLPRLFRLLIYSAFIHLRQVLHIIFSLWDCSFNCTVFTSFIHSSQRFIYPWPILYVVIYAKYVCLSSVHFCYWFLVNKNGLSFRVFQCCGTSRTEIYTNRCHKSSLLYHPCSKLRDLA